MSKQDQFSSQIVAVITKILGFGYHVDKVIAMTRTCTAVKINNSKESRDEVIWISRFSLKSATEASFSMRMRELEKLTFSPSIVSFGLDGELRPYVIEKYVGLRQLGTMGSSLVEQALVYIEDMIRAVGQVHYLGFALGDVSLSSFHVDSDGRLWLGSIIGPVDEHTASQALKFSGPDSRRYLSPEALLGEAASAASDVYALGVISYYLLTGNWITEEEALAASGTIECVAPTVLCPGAPAWVDDLIGSCLSTDPSARIGDAVKMLEFIEHAKQNPNTLGGSVFWAPSTLSVHVEKSSDSATEEKISGKEENLRNKKSAGSRVSFDSTWIRTVFLFGCVLCLALFLAFRIILGLNPGGDTQQPAYSFQKMIGLPPEILAYLQDLIAKDSSLEHRRETLNKIALNESPLVNKILFDIARGEMGTELSETAVNLVEERIRKNGLTLTANLFLEWKSNLRKEGRNAAQELILWPLLSAADPRLSPDERKKAIYDVYSKQKDFGLQYACAIAIDQESTGEFLEPFKELVSQKYPDIRIGGLSMPAIVLGFREPSMVFGGFILPRLSSLSDEDLSWLLKRDTIKEFRIFFLLSREVLKRNMLKPERRFFFEVLDEKWPVVSPKVLDALVAVAEGNTTVDSVYTLAEWYSPKQDLVLLRLCAIEQELAVAQVAFEKALNRTVTSQPMKGIVDWVRVNGWTIRGKFAKPVAIIAFPEQYGFDKVIESFETLSELMDKKVLFTSFISSVRPEYIVLALDRFGTKSVPEDLISFLKHDDSLVRIAALKSMRSTNTLDFRKLMTKRYREETDPKVKAAYEEYHSYVLTAK